MRAKDIFKFLLPVLITACFVSVFSAGAVQIENPLQSNTFAELLNKIIDFIFTLSLGIVPLMIIIAGVYFVTAMGDPTKIETAKKIILWTVIGFIVIICAKGFIDMLQTIFTNQGSTIQ